MSDRYFSAAPIHGDRAALTGSEAHHLLHVMRARVGDGVTLFDGSGAEFAAEVLSCGREAVELRVLGRREVDREAAVAVTIAASLPKGDRQKWLIEKLTELGVARFVPLVTERGVAQPAKGALERLRRTVVEASKQCARNRLMQIAEPLGWGEFVTMCGEQQRPEEDGKHAGEDERKAATVDDRPPALRLVAHPGGRPLGEVLRGAFGSESTQDAERVQRPSFIAAVGPEGGLTPAEVEAAIAAGWQTVDLGRRILRVETAAMALAAGLTAGAG